MSAEPGTVRYPRIVVPLLGGDGNAMILIAKVRKALKRAGVPDEEVLAFTEEVTSGDYDNVLQTCMRWVEVE